MHVKLTCLRKGAVAYTSGQMKVLSNHEWGLHLLTYLSGVSGTFAMRYKISPYYSDTDIIELNIKVRCPFCRQLPVVMMSYTFLAHRCM